MAYMKRMDFYERIEGIKAASKPDACWLWPGSTVQGYGQVGWGTRGNEFHGRVHRLAYEHWIGPIPDDLPLDHLCRNRRCFNPSHLEPVIQAINVLRGEGPSAHNAAKTHCRRGHLLHGDNVRPNHPDGHRDCRTCHNERRREKYATLSREERRKSRGVA